MAITPGGNTIDTINTNGDYIVGGSASGSLTIDGGSIFKWNDAANAATTVPGTEEVLLYLGQNAGQSGVVNITGAGSQLYMNGTGIAGTGMLARIGSSGSGTMNITAGGAFRMIDAIGAGNATSAQTGLDGFSIAQSAGSTGALNVNAGTVEVNGTGAFLNVTRNGGNGSATFENNSQLILTSRTGTSFDGAFMQVGRGTGTGVMTIDHSTATLTAAGSGNAFVSLGRDSGNGTLNLVNSATLSLMGGTSGANISLGHDSNFGGVVSGNTGAGSAGTAVMNVTNSIVSLDAVGGGSSVMVGRHNNAIATLNLNAGAIVNQAGEGGGSSLLVGYLGNAATTGTVNVNSGAVYNDHYHGTTAGGTFGMVIGNTGTGTVNVNTGAMHFTTNNATSSAFVHIGFNFNNSSVGTGHLNISNGVVDFNGLATGGAMNIGRGAGSTGTVAVTSGGVLDLDGATGQKMSVNIGIVANTTFGQMIISGNNSVVRGASNVQVGVFQGADNSSSADLGVINGGLLDADNVTISAGGFLTGNGGTIDATVFLQNRGQIGDTVNAIGTTTITGDLTFEGGTIEVDIGAGATNHDRTNASGIVTLNGGTFRFDAVGGYKFTAGEDRVVLTGGSFSGNGAISAGSFSVTNQHADFGWAVGQLNSANQNVSFRALTSGTTGGIAVLDFGSTSIIAADLTYDSTAKNGDFGGGVFGVNSGGFVYNLDEVRGTAAVDVFTVTGTGGMLLDGRDGNDILTGGSGADTLLGGNNDDTLDGRAGADSIDGGAGNDTIIYDAADISVLGGAGFDTAILTAGVARGFAMAANSIELLQWNEFGTTVYAQYYNTPLPANPALTTFISESITDTASTQVWSNYYSYYNANWLLERATQVNDTALVSPTVAKTTETVWDIANVQSWATFTNNYDLQGRVISQALYNDVGDPTPVIENFWDYTGGTPWKQFENRYALLNGNYAVTKQSLILDTIDQNPTATTVCIRETYFDWNNTQPTWNQWIREFNNAGTLLNEIFV